MFDKKFRPVFIISVNSHDRKKSQAQVPLGGRWTHLFDVVEAILGPVARAEVGMGEASCALVSVLHSLTPAGGRKLVDDFVPTPYFSQRSSQHPSIPSILA